MNSIFDDDETLHEALEKEGFTARPQVKNCEHCCQPLKPESGPMGQPIVRSIKTGERIGAMDSKTAWEFVNELRNPPPCSCNREDLPESLKGRYAKCDGSIQCRRTSVVIQYILRDIEIYGWANHP